MECGPTVALGLLTGGHHGVVFILLFSCHLQSEDHASSPGHAHHAGSSPTHAHHTSGSTSGEDQYGAGELFKPDNAPKEAGPALGEGGQEALSRPAGSTPPQVQPKEGVEAKLASSSTEQKLRVKVCVCVCVCVWVCVVECKHTNEKGSLV